MVDFKKKIKDKLIVFCILSLMIGFVSFFFTPPIDNISVPTEIFENPGTLSSSAPSDYMYKASFGPMFWRKINDMDIQHGHLYMVRDNTDDVTGNVVAYNISDPLNPVGVDSYGGSFDLYGCVKAHGDFVYAGRYGTGAWIDVLEVFDDYGNIDFTYTAAINIQNSSTTYTPKNIVAYGDYLFVQGLYGSSYYALGIVDISDPHNPALISCIETPDTGWSSMVIEGDLIYTFSNPLTSPRLQIFNISGPPPYDLSTSLVAEVVTERSDVIRKEGHLIYTQGGAIIDVLDPTNPVVIGSWHNHINYPGSFAVRNKMVYYQYKGDFYIIDATDPSYPVIAGSYESNVGHYNAETLLYGPYVFLGTNYDPPTGYGVFQVLQIADYIDPSVNKDWFQIAEKESLGTITDIECYGDYLFATANETYLYVYDISNMSNPNLIMAYASSFNELYALTISGHHVFIGGRGTHARIEVLDISDPWNVTLAGYLEFNSLNEPIRDIYLDGKVAYLAVFGWGLQSINITNLDNIVLMGRYDVLINTAVKVVVDGDVAYVCDRDANLKILNVSDPFAISLLDQYEPPAATEVVSDIEIFDNFAFLATGYDNYVLNISDPSNVQTINEDANDVLCFELFGTERVYGRRYLSWGIGIYNITEPSNLAIMTAYVNWIPNAENMIIQGEYAFVATWTTICIYHLCLGFYGDFDGDGVNGVDEVLMYGSDYTLVDTDSDGMDDYYENIEYGAYLNAINGSDASIDQDGDGLTNLEEYQRGTNLTNTDSDSDLLDDYEEAILVGTNPLDDDTDNDGIIDYWDDQDGDNFINGWELGNSTNPKIYDTDNDGLNDYEDIISFGLNGTDSDTDDDGLGDFEEVKIYNTNGNSIDSDGDNLNDSAEILTFSTNPNKADTDNDGLDDNEEINTHFTNPLAPDSDFDGLSDSYEISIGTNASSPDTDSDGVNDFGEINTYLTDPTIADSDSDGLLDGEEIFTYGTNPSLNDTDGDTLTDGDEISIHNSDPSLVDTDSDLLDDNVEVGLGSNPRLSDSDADGLDDYSENQRSTGLNNPDSDGDGLLDGIEVYNFQSNPLVNDTDLDGLLDGEEVNTYSTDPLKSDTDGDGLNDMYEVGIGTSPILLDSDGDNLNDGAEIQYLTNYSNPDSDGDGLLDGAEVFGYGTNPNNDDSDYDGLSDFDEVNATYGYITDPTKADTDMDRLNDNQEVTTYLTDPLSQDTDSDTISDGDEVLTYFSDPTSADADNDGLSDYEEIFVTKTDPNSADSDADGINDSIDPRPNSALLGVDSISMYATLATTLFGFGAAFVVGKKKEEGDDRKSKKKSSNAGKRIVGGAVLAAVGVGDFFLYSAMMMTGFLMVILTAMSAGGLLILLLLRRSAQKGVSKTTKSIKDYGDEDDDYLDVTKSSPTTKPKLPKETKQYEPPPETKIKPKPAPEFKPKPEPEPEPESESEVTLDFTKLPDDEGPTIVESPPKPEPPKIKIKPPGIMLESEVPAPLFWCESCQNQFKIDNADPMSDYMCPNCKQILNIFIKCGNCGGGISMSKEEYGRNRGTAINCPNCTHPIQI
ncbi:MAG: hypothetical protein ACFFCS_08995 [Candidatus Hodarchaeota archaeon]